MKKIAAAIAVCIMVLGVSVALANDQYHVYKVSNGSCEVDTRDHEAMKSARGSDTVCLGHFDYSSDAHNLLEKLQSEGTCKK
jgi:hypothetical protein